MKFKLELTGKEYELLNDPRFRDLSEAEHKLGKGLDGTATDKVMVYMFCSVREIEPEADVSGVQLADEILNMRGSVLEEASEVLEDPPAVEPATNGGEIQPTTGQPLSDQSESPSLSAISA